MPHTEANIIRTLVDRIGKRSPLLRQNDSFQKKTFLLELAVKEVDELRQELNKPDAERNEQKIVNEYWDIWVFVVSWIQSFEPDYDIDSQLYHTNGDGKKSAILTEIDTYLEESEDLKTLRIVLRLLYSLGKYLPHATPTLSSLSELVDDVLVRRDPKYYNLVDPDTGLELPREEVPIRFKYLETCMRLIRNWVKEHEGRETITEADKAPFHHILLDFRGGEKNIQKLKEILAQKKGFRYDPQRGLIVPSHMYIKEKNK